MEELIARVIEQSIVSGGFLFLLYHVIHKQEERLEQITKVLTQMSQQLSSLQIQVNELERKDDK